jgi:hypothetical protein
MTDIDNVKAAIALHPEAALVKDRDVTAYILDLMPQTGVTTYPPCYQSMSPQEQDRYRANALRDCVEGVIQFTKQDLGLPKTAGYWNRNDDLKDRIYSLLRAKGYDRDQAVEGSFTAVDLLGAEADDDTILDMAERLIAEQEIAA